jgi:hypothetical protein
MILLSSANAASGSRLARSQDDSTVIIACFHTARIAFKQGWARPVLSGTHHIRRDASLRGSIRFTQGQPTIYWFRFPHARATTAVPICNKRNLDRHERSDRDGCLLNRPGLMLALPRQEQHLNRSYPQHGRHTPPYRRRPPQRPHRAGPYPTDSRSDEVQASNASRV